MDLTPKLRVWALVLLLGLTLACARPTALVTQVSDWQAEGPIQVIDGQTWVVGSHLVTVPLDARIEGQPAVGAVARVAGVRDQHGRVIAQHVRIVPVVQAPTREPVAPADPPAVRQRDDEDDAGEEPDEKEKDNDRKRGQDRGRNKSPKSPKT